LPTIQIYLNLKQKFDVYRFTRVWFFHQKCAAVFYSIMKLLFISNDCWRKNVKLNVEFQNELNTLNCIEFFTNKIMKIKQSGRWGILSHYKL
jgi:hypothetical protein